MRIIFTDHLASRLKQRGISAEHVKQVLKKSREKYWDNLRKHHIAISRVLYLGRVRKVLVAYDTIGNSFEAITIHPISDEEINQRIASGRWSHEKIN